VVDTPIRSRLLDYVESVQGQPSAGPAQAATPGQGPRRSRLLDYVDHIDHADYADPPVTEQPPGPKPGVPAYHTPVFVPAHPRYADTTDPSGAPARVPFIAYELFEHPPDKTVAFAFTTLAGLVTALGEAQPWVATSLGPLAEGLGAHGAGVLLDPRIAQGPHNWQSADLAAYAREVS
jgi:hypothetical protein